MGWKIFIRAMSRRTSSRAGARAPRCSNARCGINERFAHFERAIRRAYKWRRACRRPFADVVIALSADRTAARVRSMRAVPHGGNLALRRTRPGLVLEQSFVRRAHRYAFRRADPLDHWARPAE